MTLLPPKNNLVGLNQTQGTVRTALGDFLDTVREAIGSSGTSPVITNPTIVAAPSVGIGNSMVAPGTTLQVFGSFSVTDTNAPATNPGVGSGFVTHQLMFGSLNTQKLLLHPATGQSLGVQSGTVYIRVPLGGGMSLFEGGTYTSAPYNAGTGGAELFRISSTDLLYKGQPVYTMATHGASLANLNSGGQSWTGLQNFNDQVTVRGAEFTLGSPTRLTPVVFNWGLVGGTRMMFGGYTEVLSLGVQTDIFTSTYIRSDGFSVYMRGSHHNSYGNPGTGGTVLFQVDNTKITWKNQRLLDVSMYGHRADGSGINADMVDGIHGGSLMTRHSTQRPGTLQLWRWDSDTPDALRMEWYQNRMWLFSWNTTSATTYQTAVDFSATSALAANSAALGGLNVGSFVLKTSGNRPGTTQLFRHESDLPQALKMEGNDGRLRLIAYDTVSGVQITNSVDYAYSAGTAQNISGSVPVNQLHRGTNSVRLSANAINGGNGTSLVRYDVNSNAFADFIISGNTTGRWVFTASVSEAPQAPYKSHALFVPGSTTPTGSVTAEWTFLTNSGHPELWIAYDASGNIHYMAEAEDIIHEDGSCPLHGLPPELTVDKFDVPSLEKIKTLKEPLIKQVKKLPKNIIKKLPKHYLVESPDTAFEALLENYILHRGYSIDLADSLEELVYDQDSTFEKQQWRQLLILRALQGAAYDNPLESSIDLIQNSFKVIGGKLTLK